MKVAVVGCGAMGSIYAGRLAAAGHRVLGIGRRPESVEVINRQGITVIGPDGQFTAPVRAALSASEPVDLIVLAVKATDIEQAAAGAVPLMGDETVVLTIQNGLGASDTVARTLGSTRLAVGIASGFGASLRGPGVVHHNAMQAIRVGAYDSLDPPLLEKVVRAFSSAGFTVERVDDILAMQWEKLICNAAFSGPCAVTGLPIGAILADEDLSKVSRDAAVEAWETARALGVALQVDDPAGFARAFGERMPRAKPSVLQDLEAGRLSEIDFINGAVPREAAKVGRVAPVNATLTALIRAQHKVSTPTMRGPSSPDWEVHDDKK